MSLRDDYKNISKKAHDREILNKIMETVGDETDDLTIHQNNFLNIAYYVGKQWLTYDTSTKQIMEAPQDNSKVRITVNRVKPIVRANLGKLTKNKPIMTVVPATTEQEDIDSAKTGDKVLEFLEEELQLQSVDRATLNWGIITSLVFVKPFWNQNKGEPIPGTNARTGECDIDVVNRFEVQYDRTAKTWQDVKWICHNKLRDVNYVKAMYPEHADEVSEEDDISENNIYDIQLQSLGKKTEFGQKNIKGMVRIKEYWEKPSFKYPKGRRATFTKNGVLLFYSEDIGFGETDDTERELPFFPFKFIDIPGLVEGQSAVDDLRPLQREYNIARSQLINNKNMLGGPRWLVEENSLTNDEISNEPDAIIEYAQGHNMPQQIPAMSISSDIANDINSLVEEFYFISGQNDVSHGNTNESKVKSGIAIQYLEEQDDTKIGPTVKNWIDCKKRYCRYLLKMVKNKYTEPRTLKIVGKDNQLETMEFTGSDLTSYDVRIQESSMLQESRTAKEERIFGLVDKGILTVDRDRELILKMLELGTTDLIYNEYAIDINKAHFEEFKWQHGDFNTPTSDFFNHEIHINEHNKFRKSSEYEKLDEAAKAYIDAHIQEHINWLVHSSATGPQTEQPLLNNTQAVM